MFYRMSISYFVMDPMTEHTINLLQYTKQMNDLHQQLQQAPQSYKVFLFTFNVQI